MGGPESVALLVDGTIALRLGATWLVAILAPFRVTTTLLGHDALVMAGATVVAVFMLADQSVSRLEGTLLLTIGPRYWIATALN